MFIFKLVYWLGMLAEIVARAPYQKTWRAGQKTTQRISLTEQTLLSLLTVFALVVPLLYSVTPWLNFANYPLPAGLSWLGVALLAGAVAIFARAHMDLKANWSPSLEIRADHTLVTHGIYRVIRHPMYASQFLWAIAQSLLLPNWLAGPLNLVFVFWFYRLRVGAEEKLMLATFGEPYRDYMRAVGGVIPHLSARPRP